MIFFYNLFQFGNTIPLVKPIEFILKHKSMDDFSERKCVYWNFEEDGWSQNGCYPIKEKVLGYCKNKFITMNTFSQLKIPLCVTATI